jgi:hypothetical protein
MQHSLLGRGSGMGMSLLRISRGKLQIASSQMVGFASGRSE